MAKPKQISGIDCDAEATAAIRRIVTVRLGEMCALRTRALDTTSPEGVHDMRVASRRLRSALRDFVPYSRKPRIANPLKEIKKIADALGRVRDQDVAIIALEKLERKAPPEVSPGIRRLAENCRAKRAQAQEELIPVVNEACLTQLQSNFLPALEAATRPAASRKNSRPATNATIGPTFREVARVTILDRLKEFEKLSDSLFHPLKAKRLHKMRIAAKRLRYALDLFGRCWGKQLIPFSTRVAELQSLLGELHDCDVRIVEFGDDLSGKAVEPAESDKADSERRVASTWLLDRFVKLRTKYFRSALARWRKWETSDHSEQLRMIVETDCRQKPNR